MSGWIGAFRTRTFGLIRGKRRRRMFLGALAPIAVLGAVLISNAVAVHDVGLFELDQNAEDTSAANLPDDWQTLYEDSTAPFGHSLIFTGILADTETASDVGDQFAGGGSKDNNNISEWRWKEGEPLDKDDITNAYSAGYTIPAGAPGTGTGADDNKVGDFVVYFGLDRFATDGDAQVGFWFTQQNIAKTNVKKNGAFTFSGNHVNGDVLVQSNFTKGGDVDSVTVYEWDNTVSGNLRQLETAGDCTAPLLTDDIACATVNKSSTPSPWTYIPKGSSADSDFPQGAFYEGGINLSRLARRPGAPATGCLSTFIAETRSSQQFDAVLKDLDLGNFDTCDASVSTQSSTNATNLQPGASVSDTAIIAGSSLVGGSPPRPTGEVKFYLCSPTQVTTLGCPTGGTLVSTDTTLVDNPPSPPNNDSLAESTATTNTTAVGKYCWRAEYTPDTASGAFYSATSHTNAGSECFEVAAQPTTTTTRQFVYPQDKAKITASSAGTLGGNVTFKLFASFADCSANTNPVHTEGPITVTGSGTPSTATATTTNYPGGSQLGQGGSPYRIDSDTSVWWRVSFVSTNTAHLDSVSDCHLDSNAVQQGEKTTVSFLGNDSGIALP